MFSFIGNKVDLTDAIRCTLKSLNGFWDQHPHRRTASDSPHSEMTDIWVRFGDIKKGLDHILGPHDSVWYTVSEKMPIELNQLINWLYSEVGGVALGGVLITKLPSGGCIAPHIDSGWHSKEYQKFHVSINTPKNSFFGFPDKNLISENGDINWFRNDVLHWVCNDSDEDRVSMIICIKTDKFSHLMSE